MADRKAEALQLLCEEGETFVETIATLRRLITVAHPEATSLDKNPLWQEAIHKASKTLPHSKRDTFFATMAEATPFAVAILQGTAHTSYLDTSDDKLWKEADPIEILPESVREGLAEGREAIPVEGKAAPDFKFMTSGSYARIGISDPQIRAHFWEVMRRMQRDASSPSHAALLIRAALTMAVGAFEVLIGNLYRSHITANPNAAENPDVKSFSLADLYAFGSIDDAVEETIYQQSDQFSRKGIRSWAAWFGGKPLFINMDLLALEWAQTQEIFERRNLVVHNGSRVTRQYLHNVDRSLTKDVHEGQPIDVTPGYIDLALAHLSTLGILLTFKVRLKLFSRVSRESTSEWLAGLAFDLLAAEQFETVQHVAHIASTEDLVQLHLNQLKVNGWIARGRLHGLDSCREEVESWDTSALDPLFPTAKHVLLGDTDPALCLIKECFASGKLGVHELLNWPLFHWLREEGALADLVAAAPETDDPVVEVTGGAVIEGEIAED